MDAIKTHARRRPWLAGAVLVGLVWVVAMLVLAVGALASARSGLSQLEAARDTAADDGASALLAPGGTDEVARSLGAAGSDFGAANASLSSPVLAPLKALPVLGRQVRSAEALTGAGADALDAADDALGEVRPLVEGDPPRGTERVTLSAELAAVADTASDRLAEVDLGPDEALIGTLAEARVELRSELSGLSRDLDRLSATARAVADLLEGPSRYLVLAANNAEMRAGSGMFLSAGVLEIVDGRMELGEVRPTGELQLPPGSVAVEGDLAENWSWLDPARDFRNLGLTPRFPVSAELARAMWAEREGVTVDGVLAVDPEGLAAVLAAVGPVTVEGEELGSDDVVAELLHDQYVGLDDLDSSQIQRRDRLGEVASETLAALEDRSWETGTLIEELSEAARGRHLLLWGAEPLQQAGWAAAGVAGELTERSLAVSLINRGGNKLDWFTSVQSTLGFDFQLDGSTVVTATVDIENATPSGESAYIASNELLDDLPRAHYGGILTVHLPEAATAVAVEGGDYASLRGVDGPTRVVGQSVTVEPGATETVVVTFTVPPGHPPPVLEPTARVPGTEWVVEGSTTGSDLRRNIEW